MDLIIVIATIAAGLLLFIAEVFLIPGLSLAGIASAGCLIFVNYYAFTHLSMTGGAVTLLISVAAYLLVFIWFIKSKSIDKLALHKDIDSTVGTPEQSAVKPGDEGIAITRLALIGNAELNGNIIEVKSAGGFIDERTPIVVDRIQEGIAQERSILAGVRAQADMIIDTTTMKTSDLKEYMVSRFSGNEENKEMQITVFSFGFKYGIPIDADMVIDVRFLPNPYYVDELRPQTGMDDGVYNYVMQNQVAKDFADKLEDMMKFLIPNYAKEGKTNLVIAIGCTGGKHRSVTLARVLYERLHAERGFGIRLEHRDIGKDALRKK